MSTLNDILNTSRRALMVQQLAMQVVGQNTANVNTEGYSRRRIELTTAPPFAFGDLLHHGSGVDVLTLGRVRDRILDDQIRRGSGAVGYWSERDAGLGAIEEMLNPLGETGLNSLLQEFWNAWHDLANDPEGMAPRRSLVQKAEALAASIRRTHGDLVNQRALVDRQLIAKVDEVNRLTSQIAQLNVRIVQSEDSGHEASDLRDTRDRALERLAKLMDITSHENADGAVNVYTGGSILVQVDHFEPISLTSNSYSVGAGIGRSGVSITLGQNATPLAIAGGEIRALLDVRDQDIGQVMKDLDEFARALAVRVNEVHVGGYGLTGTNGIEFFANDITGAADFRLSTLIATDPSRIATASYANSPGDNSVALRIAGIAQERLLQDGRSTLSDFFQDSVLSLSSKKSAAAQQLTIESASMEHLQNRRQQVSGVSMDEELTRLIQVQQAYEAAAKVISVIDEMMQTVLTIGGGV